MAKPYAFLISVVLILNTVSSSALADRGRRRRATPTADSGIDGSAGGAPNPAQVQPYTVTQDFTPSESVIRRLNGTNLFSSVATEADGSKQVCGGLTLQGKDVSTCISTPSPVVPVTILYSHPPNRSGARGGNCVGLFDATGQFVSLGCNKDGNVVNRPITINASATTCNSLRIVLYVQGDPALDVPIASWPPPSQVGVVRDTSWRTDSCGGNEIATSPSDIGAMYFVNQGPNVIAGQITDRTPSGGGCPVTPNDCNTADMVFSLTFPSSNFTIQNSNLPCSDPGSSGYRNLPC